jgi:hypothetical protein
MDSCMQQNEVRCNEDDSAGSRPLSYPSYRVTLMTGQSFGKSTMMADMNSTI